MLGSQLGNFLILILFKQLCKINLTIFTVTVYICNSLYIHLCNGLLRKIKIYIENHLNRIYILCGCCTSAGVVDVPSESEKIELQKLTVLSV
jgi:hypothetical protein